MWFIFYQGRVALRRRGERGLLAGLWEYPNELSPTLPEAWGIVPLSDTYGGQAKHIFTHLEWHMTGRIVQAASPALPEGWVWADRDALRDVYPVPSAFSGLAHLVEGHLGHGGLKKP